MKIRSLIITAILLISAIVALNPSIAKADILVYDNNNQYLGILLALNPSNLELFIPSLSAAWEFDTRHAFGCPQSAVYFESSDCTGTPYTYGPQSIVIDLSTLLGRFYKPDLSGKKTITRESEMDEDCQCSQYSRPAEEYYPVTVEVQMPFTTPIALPIRFEVRTRAVVIPLN